MLLDPSQRGRSDSRACWSGFFCGWSGVLWAGVRKGRSGVDHAMAGYFTGCLLVAVIMILLFAAALLWLFVGSNIVPAEKARFWPDDATESQHTVDRSTKVLNWLKAHQCEDGSWRDGDNPAASTALAVLAYLSCVETPGRSKAFGVSVLDHPVARASEYLIGYASRITAAKGKMTPQDETALPIVARALSEGWNLTKNPNLKEAASACLELVVERSRKLPDAAKSVGSTDTLLWASLALKSGGLANITVEGLAECYASLTNYLERCGCDENSYYDGLRKYKAGWRIGSTKEQQEAFRGWHKAKMRDWKAAFVEETVDGNAWKRGYFDFPATSPNSTGLGATADAALALLEFMIDGAGYRVLPWMIEPDAVPEADSDDQAVGVDI